MSIKAPIDLDSSPIAGYLSWFSDKSSNLILTTQEPTTLKQLKHNVLKTIDTVNKLFQNKIDAWHYFRSHEKSFGIFLKAAMRMALSEDLAFDLSFADRYQLLTFLNYSFNSIEVEFVNAQIKRYLPLSIWINLSPCRRQLELSKLPKRIQLAWEKLEEQDKRLEPCALKERMFERTFMFNYVNQFLKILPTAVGSSSSKQQEDAAKQELELNAEVALYCQRFLEFIIDIESQLPLRRFFHSILNYTHFIVRCQFSDLAHHKSPEGHLFDQLVELLLLYTRFEIDLMTGESLSDVEILKNHENKILNFQKILWSKYQHLKSYAIKPIKAIDNPSALYKIITSFDSKEELFNFLKSLNLVDDSNMSEEDQEDAPLMASILMNHYRRFESQMKKISTIPLFPNESVIWDTNLVPDQYYNYDYPLALPKLNLQFLTMSDYLLRNFMLFKNESTYEIRQDLEEGIRRSKCRFNASDTFVTGPKQRMALIIKEFSVFEVGKPRLGEDFPSVVRAKIIINMDYVKPEWRREWEQLRKHDTCFLVSFLSPKEKDTLNWPEGTFPEKNRIKYVRGCEIECLLDSEGKVVDENLEKPVFTNNYRTFLVWMDCNQYKNDQLLGSSGIDNLKVYEKFHLMVRRKPEKNNFKGVLETIRTLINTKFVVPDWLRDLLIGFGDPSVAHHSALNNEDEPVILDFYDTFIDFEHLKESFETIEPNLEIKIDEEASKRQLSVKPPFRVKIDRKMKQLSVIPYRLPSRGPYATTIPKKNTIRYTPTQIEAITSGLQKGLTMVVGPPGTGKTDVAVQTLSTLYHTYPGQRTLIVTHSNQALNQIFEKMIDLDVEEHHLLRLGHGEGDLQSAKDFSRQGRVRYVLARRLELLVLVSKLARSLDMDPGAGFTCESSEYFQFYHILPRWQEYVLAVKGTENLSDIGDKFPFTKFFDDAPQPLFKRESIEDDLEVARGCYRYIKKIFNDLQSFRPFEIFSSNADRSKYLMIRESKMIAMTCTHAGLRRKELVEMKFQYDNIVMEETAQILEIETTIPLLLQEPEKGVNRLKRWVMIGDHNQLPPIIQNSSFQKFSNMEQSLFARFIRLGFPTVELNAQGRARASLCDLYRWRYRNLVELPHVNMIKEYKLANAGFAFVYQMIDVGDYNGVGETSPQPYYYQNRGEAEYLIAVYKYMRMLGYPNDKITILTTYNGQKELLREMVVQQCNADAFIGEPRMITTVDKYQGQQNDFILLSLVRTKTVGHLRDIRRLIVAMSRARLGLYVFARVSLFNSCYELRCSMKLFKALPHNLCLLREEEQYPSRRAFDLKLADSELVQLDGGVQEMQQLVATRYESFIARQTKKLRMQEEEDEDEIGTPMEQEELLG